MSRSFSKPASLALPIQRGCEPRHLRPLSEAAFTDIGTINEAEEIEQSDSGHDVKINLPAKLCFGSGVKLYERGTVPETVVSDQLEMTDE